MPDALTSSPLSNVLPTLNVALMVVFAAAALHAAASAARMDARTLSCGICPPTCRVGVINWEWVGGGHAARMRGA
eukprot:4880096-Prymnesium_polylepis.1